MPYRTTESKLEALMSALWRLQARVFNLFSPALRTMVGGG